MMIPEAWENHAEMDPARRAFYEFHSTLHGAVGRPGLRHLHRRHRSSARCSTATACARAATGSPTTAWSCWPARSACSTSTRPAWSRKGRLQPGRMFLVDTEHGRHRRRRRDQGRARRRAPVRRVAARRPDPPRRPARARARRAHAAPRCARRQQTFGYTEEELRILLAPMARTGAEPLGSMGTDTPVAVLSDRPRLLFDYFTQLFAQVTNPPLDAIREELVTSLGTTIGPGAATCSTATPGALPPGRAAVPGDRQRRARQDRAHQRRRRPARLRHRRGRGPLRRHRRRRRRCAARLDEICAEVSRGDRRRRPVRRAVRPRLRPRPRADPVAAADLRGAPPPDPREDPHPGRPASSRPATCARCTTSRCSIGYGAAAVNPYLAMESVEDLVRSGVARPASRPRRRSRNLIKALGKGVLKVMSKMGISTVASYRGAQVFEAIGLGQELVDRVLHRHDDPARRRRPRRHRRRGRPPGTPTAYPPDGVAPAAPPARRRRRVPVAPRGRAAPVRPGDGVPAAARDPRRAATTSSSSTPRGSTSRPSG